MGINLANDNEIYLNVSVTRNANQGTSTTQTDFGCCACPPIPCSFPRFICPQHGNPKTTVLSELVITGLC